MYLPESLPFDLKNSFIMNIIKTLFLSALTSMASLQAMADGPFRQHRYDALNVLPVTESNIVFIGNSITNMHEWWEAFDNPQVINRGVSGAVSDELVANLSPILGGHPAKAFLMIGTNDLGTAGIDNAPHVAKNVRTVLERFRRESPTTKVYVQSILPSRRRNLALQRITNDSLRHICQEMGVEYIDLWNDLLSVSTDNQHTLDGLHLQASGYRVWCRRIAPLVGSACIYPREFSDRSSGLHYSNGMRATQFDVLPVRDGDVLMIGDEMVHSGEWHELLRSDRVRSRSIGWGYPGIDIRGMAGCLDAIFHGRPNNGTPSKAFFYVGEADLWDKGEVSEIAERYAAMLDEAHRLSPATELVVGTLLPCGNEQMDEERIPHFNQALKKLAAERKYVSVVDLHDVLSTDGKPAPTYMQGAYVSGKGYLRLAEVLRPVLLGK